MIPAPISNIVIVGGGTAGWMAAAAFAHVLGPSFRVRLIESEVIGIVGVGEATVPHIKAFNNLLRIDEAHFVRSTQGTFKLGIQFIDWGRIGDSYVHGFGTGIGPDLGLLPFHQYWIKARLAGRAREIGVEEVLLHAETGFVESVRLKSGERVSGELFIDCTGFRGLLIEEALHTGYVDYTHWLPCDRAVAVPCEKVEPPTPYTRSSAREAGWQWRIPLQHRTGNGYVYSSGHLRDDEAVATVLANLDGSPLAEPKLLHFTSGRRKKCWNRNVVALGLASGFLEPLESTSIHLIQSGISKLLELFPREGFDDGLVDRYNARLAFEFDRIRDFLVLHYHATERDDTDFWNQCRTMSIPDELQAKIDLFREISWIEVMLGQRIEPRAYHPLVDRVPDADIYRFLDGVAQTIERCVGAMPKHQAFIDRHCAATSPPASRQPSNE
jgi:tryptophan halogenase